MTKIRRAACLWLTGIMAASFVTGNLLAFADSKSSKQLAAERYDTVNLTDVTGKVDLSSVAMQNLSPNVLKNAGLTQTTAGTKTVIVRLGDNSVSESVPDGEKVSEYISSYAGSKKLKSIKNEQTDFLNSLASLGVSYKLLYQYTTVTNSVAIEVDASYISAIKSIPGVQSAYFSQTYSRPKVVTSKDLTFDVTENYSKVYETGIYDSSEVKYNGTGMTVAVLDTGLDYTHEAFTTYMPDPESDGGMKKSDVADKLNREAFNAVARSAAKGVTITADDLYVNAKVPFGYDYADNDADVYPSYSQHGTHVAGIVAGHADYYKDKNGNKIESEFKGVAPNAQLVICKVFTDDFESKDLGGATTEDIVAALDDCVALGVDVINMSLGTASGFSSGFMDGDDEGKELDRVYRAVKEAGISLIAAASNEYSAGYGSAFGTNLATNPDSGTVGSPSTFDGAVSVASVNGLQAPFMVANGTTPIFYTEASDSNSVRYDFNKLLLSSPDSKGNGTSETFKYVVVGNYGEAANYTTTIERELNDKSQGRTIALVSRGKTTFEAKVRNAKNHGADAVIIYNNVAGGIGISIGDLDEDKELAPAVSITMDEGAKLRFDSNGKPVSTGTIEISTTYKAGPFMNEYSSWGATPDLKLKPDVTSHGGDITSTVAGGYAEQSGTSMASPNLAGFVALVRQYVKEDAALKAIHGGDPQKITRLVNQLVMSTATTVYDQNGLPYSPRKQGSGLATLKNIFGEVKEGGLNATGAYLWTDNEANEFGSTEDNRPKVELKELEEDENGKVKFTFSLHVSNFGDKNLDFVASSLLFTETLSSDRISVAEKAYILGDIAPVWTLNGNALASGETFTVTPGQSAKITVTLELSEKEKNYINSSFPNGMFVEGFITLKSQTPGQCDLNLPFMGFYGDWESAPMLDYDAYEIAEIQKDTNIPDDQKPKESVWATQAFANYANNQYAVPMGGYLYVQDESAEQIYANTEYAAISRFNIYYGEDDTRNYLTAYQIKALYAGLLRNAAVVTYDLYDAETGEIIKKDNVYRVGKAYAGGGSSTPAQVLLEFEPDDLGLVNNGKYALDFYFYFNEDLYKEGVKTEDNTFSMTFYVDYEAPVVVDSRIKYVDHKDSSGKEYQDVYLELDIFDNTYAQSVMLCYMDTEENVYRLVGDYITPVYNPVKNGTTTVSIEITDMVAVPGKYQLCVQVDDYALNHRIFQIDFSTSSKTNLPSEFEVLGGTDITVGVNETYKVGLLYNGNANLSNFTWNCQASARYIKVKNGEIFGIAPTREGMPAKLTVTGANNVSKTINVTVVDNGKKLTYPTDLSFGMIKDNLDSLVKAEGTVKVHAGTTFTLDVIAEPWYYDLSEYELSWRSSNEQVAVVDQQGNVTVLNEKGSTTIYAEIKEGSTTKCSAIVNLSVQDPFTISNFTLTKYSGTQETVIIPDDKNITTIGDKAFEDNTSVVTVIIPKTVTTIDKNAFVGCTKLKYVYFIDTETREIPDANLSTIRRFAFAGCTSLEKVDLSNCKTITVDRSAFEGCTGLKEIVKMDNIGTMLSRAFYGCSALESVDLTGMHVAGSYVFGECTSLNEVITGYWTAIGTYMFYGCTSLKQITLNAKIVEANAFANCTELTSVTFGNAPAGETPSETYIIGAHAFDGCSELKNVDFNGKQVTEIGDMAFANCTALSSFTVPAGLTRLGDSVFYNSGVNFTTAKYSADGDTLLIAPTTVPNGFTPTGTKIAPYAFSGCTFSGTVNLNGITSIGEGAFASSNLGGNISIPAGVTEIADNAFKGTNITGVTIHANVTKIGAGAFENCENLKTVTFAGGSTLKQIGDAAFAGCTALGTISLPDGAATMGSSVFFGCTALTTATMPSVKNLGANTFVGCENLQSVTFGTNAETVGEYTFGSNAFYLGEIVIISCTKLNSVSIGTATTVIGEGAFYGCSALASIDLTNVTGVCDGAFYRCTALNPTGLSNLKNIGNMAFYGCKGISELTLTNATEIGAYAFYLGEYTSLSIPAAQSIGNYAFFGGHETTVEIPSTLKTIGYAAFANSAYLAEFTMNGEGKFKVIDGALYRVLDTVSGEEDGLELVAYPTAKTAAVDEDGTKTFAIAEGAVTVKAYAMAYLKAGTVQKVILPYSIKTIGDAAFFESGITEYQFEAINAPVLLSDFYYLEGTGVDENGETVYFADYSQYAMMESNFEFRLVYYVNVLFTPEKSTLKISYPSNGIGYDNYVYESYFGFKVDLGELMDDNTRALIKLVENFDSPDEITGWNSLAVNKENEDMVKEFSALVISAHERYNILASDYQKELFGAENEQKLFDIENALKSVKKHFNIQVKVKSLVISPDSTHKTSYKAGEKFSMDGLVLIANYEDYSTEVADMSKIILNSSYDKPLTTLDREVRLSGTGEYAGLSIRITFNVTEKESGNAGGNGGNSGNGLVIGLAVGGSVLGLIVIAVAVILILQYACKIDVIGKVFKKSKKTGVVTGDGESKEE